jgi:hypothetical protein
MIEDNETVRADGNQAGQEDKKPNGWRVSTDMTITEDDLQRELFVDATPQPVREGQPAGGEKFGEENNTSAANDKNNPSQYAGNTNPYFDRTEPMEEHPENSNFREPSQEGSPNYDRANPALVTNSAEPKPEKVERGNGENDRPHKGASGQDESSDDVNIPGPNELPDQQKVGENVGEDEQDHIET